MTIKIDKTQLQFKTANDLYNGDRYIGAIYTHGNNYRLYLAGFGTLCMSAPIAAKSLDEAKQIVLDNYGKI